MNLILSFTSKPVDQIFSSLIIVVVIGLVFMIAGKKISKLKPEDKTPIWAVPFVMIVDLINKMTKENMGKRWKAYAPYFLTLGVFLFVSNISGIFGLANPTSYLMVNAALAVITFFIIQITGIVSNGIGGYLKGFLDPIPILLPINLISEITLPISLALRLMGNVMSGSVLNKLVVGLAGWFSVPFLPFLNAIFDIFSGVIQMAVFLLLTIIFAGMKVNDKDKIPEEEASDSGLLDELKALELEAHEEESTVTNLVTE